MRRFGTQGPVHREKNYVVSRAAELADFVERVKKGRYIVIFAPRQTGKTTFFQRTLDLFANNFRDFIARAGFRVLQVPDTPQEFIGQHLLLAYFDQLVQLVGGVMYLGVPTGRGRMDLLIYHNQKKYIVETKIWEGDNRYQAGKKQLAAYLKLEGTTDGYYVVFDHRQDPEPRVETERIDDVTQSGVTSFPLYKNVPQANLF